MRRFKFGPQMGPFAVVNASPTGKADPEVIYIGESPAGIFNFEVKPYDLATHSRLVAIHTVFVPEGNGLPSDAGVAVGSDYPKFLADVAERQDGVTVSIDANATPPGNYAGLAILELEDEG